MAQKPQAYTSIPIPEDKRYRVNVKDHRILNSDSRKSGIFWPVFGYVTLCVVAPLAILVLTYWIVPTLLNFFGASKGSFWHTLTMGVLGPVLAFLFVAVVALINILMLRKYLGKVQNRYGPLHNGPGGSMQTVFDALKLIAKEDFAPEIVDEGIFTLAPALVFVSAFLLMAVIPFAPGWVFADVDAGALFVIAAGTLGGYGVLLAGWSMNNKFGLLGGLRAAAQLVSYEVPLSISLLSVCAYAGSMNLSQIVAGQTSVWYAVPLLIPFVVYLIAGLAEIKMTPFDLPEAESELVAGFNTEYGGMRFGFFFVAEFAELFLLPAVLVVFFLGGWHMLPLPEWLKFPLGPITVYPLGQGELFVWGTQTLTETSNGWDHFWHLVRNTNYAAWFLIKSALGVYFYMWIRATLPRFRDDQLMELCWKGLIPLSLIGLFLAALSKLFPAVAAVISIAVVAGALWLLVPRLFGRGASSVSKETR